MKQHHERILRRLKLHNKIRFLLYLYFLKCLEYTRFFMLRRAHYHWVGGPRKPRRIERPAIGLLFVCAMAWLEPHDYIYWCVLVGGCTALFINLHTIYRLVPVKRYHWVK